MNIIDIIQGCKKTSFFSKSKVCYMFLFLFFMVFWNFDFFGLHNLNTLVCTDLPRIRSECLTNDDVWWNFLLPRSCQDSLLARSWQESWQDLGKRESWQDLVKILPKIETGTIVARPHEVLSSSWQDLAEMKFFFR